MFATVDELLARLRSSGPGIRRERAPSLEEARKHFNSGRYHWANVAEQFRELFLGELPEFPREARYQISLSDRVRRRLG